MDAQQNNINQEALKNQVESNKNNGYASAKARNDANNANNVRNAAKVAQSTKNPYAMAAGKAVGIADKLSGGKASEKLGKALTKANKMAGLKGRILQNRLNKLNESGASDKIGNAASMKNGVAPNSSTSPMENKQETSYGGGGENFKISAKVIKWIIIASPAVLTVLIFVCLFTSASQIYYNAIGLGNADSVSSQEAEDIVKDKSDEDTSKEIEDEPIAYVYSDNNSLNFMDIKLNQVNLIQVADEKYTTYLNRKYSESDFSLLEDYYSDVISYGKKYDINNVYDFFFKLFYIYINYRDNYNVQLDMPLLMATLNIQSSNKGEVFSSNISEYTKPTADDVKNKTEYIEEFKYDGDFSDYVLSPTNNTHDIELLAQNMVSRQVEESCVDVSGKPIKTNTLKDDQIGTVTLSCNEGETYKTSEPTYELDNDKYREFLKEFLEKKYYIKSGFINNEKEEVSDEVPSKNTNTAAVGDFRKWTQCGQSWSKIKIPTSSKTICNIGCLITSISIQIARSGTATTVSPIDPGIATQKFRFVDGGNFVWRSVTKLAPNFSYYSAIDLKGLSQQNIASKLTSYNSSKYYIVLAVSKKSVNSIHHYVALDYVDTSNNKIYIMDPSSTKNTDLYSKYKLYKAHIFVKKD